MKDLQLRGRATGLGPMKLGKIPMFYLKLGKISCDIISKHINNIVILNHKNLNCRPVSSGQSDYRRIPQDP